MGCVSSLATDAQPARRPNVTAGHWVETVIGFVIPTAAVVWGVWILWRGFRPGAIRRPTGVLAGVIGFVLTCVLVILIVLAWELFKAWRRPTPRDSAWPRSSVTEVHLVVSNEAHGPAA
jgi:hypothetical protein